MLKSNLSLLFCQKSQPVNIAVQWVVGRCFFNAYDRLFAFRTHLEIREDVKAVRILTDNMISHLWMETDITIWTFHRLPQVARIALKSISLCPTQSLRIFLCFLFQFLDCCASLLCNLWRSSNGSCSFGGFPFFQLPTMPLQRQTTQQKQTKQQLQSTK